MTTIHLLSSSVKTLVFDEWTLLTHSDNETAIRNDIHHYDTINGTEFLSNYDKITNTQEKQEFYKYVVLYFSGGIFVRYNTTDEVINKINDIENLTKYFDSRHISLFQCPSAMMVSGMHHPQLLSILSETSFHPLSKLYRKTNDVIGHKMLVTSLPLSQYLEKLKLDARSTSSNEIGNELSSSNLVRAMFWFTFGVFVSYKYNK